jgi:hypothetical protein
LSAQDNFQAIPGAGNGFEITGIAGKVFKHEAKFNLPIPSISTGIDLVWLHNTYGKREWEQRRHYPTIGVGINYINYGIDSVYGRNIAIYPCLELPIIKRKNIGWVLRIGNGIAYTTKKYSRQPPVDTINKAISNHINDFIIVRSDIRYHINQHWDIQAGANITHISNSSYRKPNLGVNMAGLHVGLTYFPICSSPKHILYPWQLKKDRWLAQLRLGMSMVSAQAPLGPLYPVYVVSAYGSRRWLGKNKLMAGIDYSYHNDINAYLRDNKLETGREAAQSYKSAIFAGNEFLLGRVGIVLQAGAYIKQAYIKRDAIYEKIGLSYYLVQKENGALKECSLSVFLKMHQTVAEFGELAIGIGF